MEFDIQGIVNVLKDSREAAEAREPPVNQGALTVSQVKMGSAAAVGGEKESAEEIAKKAKEIWTETEIPDEESGAFDPNDKRPEPRYEISYKQAVGTEDTYFGLSDTSPASFDCTHLVVKIHFPGSSMRDLDLDVTKRRIKATSKTLKLFTYLPMPVKKDEGAAKFDKAREVLTVTIPIDDEAD